MRLFVLVLAIVLLPLRGWMSGAMAMQMPAQALAPAAAVAGAMPPCHESAGSGADSAAAHAPGHDAPDGPAHHAPCSLCVLCHSAALGGHAELAPVAAGAHALPRTPAQRFASALPPRADKPPIS